MQRPYKCNLRVLLQHKDFIIIVIINDYEYLVNVEDEFYSIILYEAVIYLGTLRKPLIEIVITCKP